MIPLSVPEISSNEWKYVKECLDTGWVSSAGSYVNRFEEMLAVLAGAKYGVAMVNGTSALHISLILCSVKPGDEVIVPTLTFIAPVNVVRYCLAYPVFMDSNPDTLCIDVDKLADFLDNECKVRDDGFTYNNKTGRRIKAVIPVHIFGHPADMDKLTDLSEKYNLSVIEDATESLGSEYKGKKTGILGDIGCFSFNGNKIITTGGGGMLVTNDNDIAKLARHLSTQAKSDAFEYDHDEIGYNYRLTNLQAALGVAQMERLEEFVEIKRKNAVRYRQLLSNISSVSFLWEKDWVKSNFWFYAIKVPKEHKKPLMDYLISKEIQVRPIWKLIHTLPMYLQFQTYALENAINAYDSFINLPCSISLSKEDIEYVCRCIDNYFKNS
ncbi:perosamine synthetase [Candidatus Magnetoovum chiemensis]|nr:perosamine synthetase [Candidatus Magnetoovum chiemensis]